MLSKQCCPHTGIVNYFARSEPFFAVGSITAGERRSGEFHWRVYDAAKIISGIAKDMRSAEQRLEQEFQAKSQRRN
jgi:hypothetical protein